ncbi:hypothetical protein EYF80_034523 [Liparis tanakae]|uniref:Uncharacterized protein n=1 Tax=Liparis tanakae TaxID=230148 RepID=A0A4Z2GNX7_9TELE|nr:hypothetical protein EYF80_034523 [Liparis tanakae]
MQSEADRRQNLIDDLLTREKQLNATFKGDFMEPESSRGVMGSVLRFDETSPVTDSLRESLYIRYDPCAVTSPCAITRKENPQQQSSVVARHVAQVTFSRAQPAGDSLPAYAVKSDLTQRL